MNNKWWKDDHKSRLCKTKKLVDIASSKTKKIVLCTERRMMPMSIQEKPKIKKKIRYAEYYNMTKTSDALYTDS